MDRLFDFNQCPHKLFGLIIKERLLNYSLGAVKRGAHYKELRTFVNMFFKFNFKLDLKNYQPNQWLRALSASL
ncbi:hypothetical protein TYM08_P0317 [Marinicellulosiphila megalodicopiae]